MNLKNYMCLFLAAFVPASYSANSCREVFEPKAFSKKIQSLETSEIRNLLESLNSEEILSVLPYIKLEHVSILTANQLNPNYKRAKTLKHSYIPRPTITNGHYNKTSLVEARKFLSVSEVRGLLNEEERKHYGSLPDLPPHFVPHLNLKTIAGLKRSIRYLEDKVEYMTKEQIQALSLDQIRILYTSLKDTGKNKELSGHQIIKVMYKWPKMFNNLLEDSIHDKDIAEELFDKVIKGKTFKDNIPSYMVNSISLDKLSLDFLRQLRRKSYNHFFAISSERINNMEFELQEYIVRERWNSYLKYITHSVNHPQFRNFSVERLKELEPADKQAVLEKLNLSEELVIKILDTD